MGCDEFTDTHWFGTLLRCNALTNACWFGMYLGFDVPTDVWDAVWGAVLSVMPIGLGCCLGCGALGDVWDVVGDDVPTDARCSEMELECNCAPSPCRDADAVGLFCEPMGCADPRHTGSTYLALSNPGDIGFLCPHAPKRGCRRWGDGPIDRILPDPTVGGCSSRGNGSGCCQRAVGGGHRPCREHGAPSPTRPRVRKVGPLRRPPQPIASSAAPPARGSRVTPGQR